MVRADLKSWPDLYRESYLEGLSSDGVTSWAAFGLERRKAVRK